MVGTLMVAFRERRLFYRLVEMVRSASGLALALAPTKVSTRAKIANEALYIAFMLSTVVGLMGPFVPTTSPFKDQYWEPMAARSVYCYIFASRHLHILIPINLYVCWLGCMRLTCGVAFGSLVGPTPWDESPGHKTDSHGHKTDSREHETDPHGPRRNPPTPAGTHRAICRDTRFFGDALLDCCGTWPSK